MIAATELTFRSHIHPAQLTHCVRQRLTRGLWIQQRLWMGLTLIYGVILAMSVMLVCQWNQIQNLQAEAVRPVLLGAVLFLLVLEVHFFRRRRFVLTSPVTAAVVVRRKDPPHYSDSCKAGAPHLLLRYSPSHGASDEFAAQHEDDSRTVWITLNGYSSDFEQKVSAGDRVSILFDPKNPEHVEVVELDTVV